MMACYRDGVLSCFYVLAVLPQNVVNSLAQQAVDGPIVADRESLERFGDLRIKLARDIALPSAIPLSTRCVDRQRMLRFRLRWVLLRHFSHKSTYTQSR